MAQTDLCLAQMHLNFASLSSVQGWGLGWRVNLAAVAVFGV